MTSANSQRMKRWGGVVLKLAVTGLILWVIAAKTDFETVGKRIAGAELAWVALAFALIALQVTLNSYRWTRISRLMGPTLIFPKAARFYLESMFFNQALPSVIGGDALRIFRARNIGIPLRAAATGVLVDRFIGLLALLLIALGSYPIFYTSAQDITAKVAVGVLIGGGISAVIVLFAMAQLPSSWTRFRIVKEAREFCSQLQNAFKAFSAGPAALIIALTGHAIMITASWALTQSVGMDASLTACFVVVPTALIISMAPITLAGWGLREGAMTAGFILIGLEGDGGLAVSILIGLVLLAIGLIGGIVWLTSGAKSLPEEPGHLADDPRLTEPEENGGNSTH